MLVVLHLSVCSVKIKIILSFAYSVLTKVTMQVILIKKYQLVEDAVIVGMIKNGKIQVHALIIIEKTYKLMLIKKTHKLLLNKCNM